MVARGGYASQPRLGGVEVSVVGTRLQQPHTAGQPRVARAPRPGTAHIPKARQIHNYYTTSGQETYLDARLETPQLGARSSHQELTDGQALPFTQINITSTTRVKDRAHFVHQSSHLSIRDANAAAALKGVRRAINRPTTAKVPSRARATKFQHVATDQAGSTAKRDDITGYLGGSNYTGQGSTHLVARVASQA